MELKLILWYHGTINMKKYLTVEKKLSEWKSAFDLNPDMQNSEALILKSLIIKLEYMEKGEVI